MEFFHNSLIFTVASCLIRAITNASGHYLPTPGEGMNFLRLFKANGADISNATLSMYHDAGTLFREIFPTSHVRKLYD
jgi:hypothetical protein